MFTVEKILRQLGNLVTKQVIKDEWRKSFISNVTNHVNTNNALSTNQSDIILKIAKAHVNELVLALNGRISATQMLQDIDNPTFDRPPHQSVSMKREVRFIGSDKLAFRFKMDPVVVNEIKALKSINDLTSSSPKFDSKHRLWVVTVTPSNLEKIYSIISNHKFDFDEAVLEYMTLCTNSKKILSTFVYDDEGDLFVANVCNNPLLAAVVQDSMKGEIV